MHLVISRPPLLFGAPTRRTTRGLTGLVYGSIRTVTRVLGTGLEAAAGRAGPRSAGPASPEREAVLAALNGVLGDYLAATGNPLAIPMRFRRAATAGVERRAGRGHPAGRRQAARAGPRPCLNDLHGPARARPRRGAGARPRVHAGLPALQQRPAHLDQRAQLAAARDAGAAGRCRSRSWRSSPTAWAGWSRAAPATARPPSHGWPAALARRLPRHAAPRRAARARRQLVDILLGVSAYTAPLARLGSPQRGHHRPAPRQPARRGLAGARPVRARGDRPRPVALPRGCVRVVAATLSRSPGLADLVWAMASSPSTARSAMTRIGAACSESPRPGDGLAAG